MTVTLAITGSNLCGNASFSVALVPAAGGEARVRSVPRGERGDLAALCRDLCREAGVAPDAITDAIVDVGPGSYTGLRVAVTFVRFLLSFGGVSVRAVDSLALLAHRAMLEAREDATDRHTDHPADHRSVRVLLDARRGRYHVGRFSWREGALVELEPARADATEDALREIDSNDTVVAPAALANALAGQLAGRCRELRAVDTLEASALLSPGLPSSPVESDGLEPRYLMASYAED